MVAAALKVTLTDKGLKALKPAPAGTRKIVWDAQQPNFGARVTDRADADGKAAAISFIVVRRLPGVKNPVTHVLGRYPSLSLKDARAAAPAILDTISRGNLPREVEAERLREAARLRSETMAAAVQAFIDGGMLVELRRGAEIESQLRREFCGQVAVGTGNKKTWSDGPDPIWRNRPVAQIVRRDMVERLDAIKRRSGKHAARHALGAARSFFSWCLDGERFGVEASPCANVSDRTIGFARDGRELKRKRVLTDAELADVWAAATELTEMQRKKATGIDASHAFDPAEPLVKLLSLSGQRLRDIAHMRWSEIDLDAAILTVPPERYKTATAQLVPLSAAALAIIGTLPRFATRNGFALTTTGGKRPVAAFHDMKQRLDAEIAQRREADGRAPMPRWVMHDLRRTCRTRLVSDLGIDAFTAERVLGHALPGLHAVYDQGSHMTAKRDALDKWAARLLAIVEPPQEPKPGTEESNVVTLRRSA